jgi:origin recognition complex subunit 4
MSKSRLSASAGGASASGMRMWGRDVCLRAWEELVGWELVVRVGRDEGGGLNAGMCRVDVAIEEVRWAVEKGGLGDGLGRWCREV